MFHLFSSHLNDVTNQVTRTPLGMAMMYVAGIISGLLGIGSGTFKVLPVKVSTTTSNFMIGVTAAASAGIYFSRGDISPLIAAPVALGILIGALVGARVLAHLSNSHGAAWMQLALRERQADARSAFTQPKET
jgi:uncharacterized membrane protein YfcA